jgi:amidase
MYISRDAEAGTGTRGVGGPTGTAIETRASILSLFEQARRDLEAAGATVVDVDFPVVSNYEADRAGAPTIATRGLVSPEFLKREIVDLSAWAWEDFLEANGDPNFNTVVGIDGSTIFPSVPDAPHDRYDGFEDDIAVYPAQVRDHPYETFTDIPELEAGVRGLEETRRVDLEEWMLENELDAVAFPAVADVGAVDMGTNPETAAAGWRNGVWVANGNLAIRHLGIPTVTVPMGIMDDIRMPVGITFAGAAYSDLALLRIGVAYEAISWRREAPQRTPRITS